MANVHSCAQYSAETLSTLEFADGAKMIKNKAQVNKREYDNLSVDELKDKVRKLETQLQNSGGILMNSVQISSSVCMVSILVINVLYG